MSSSQYHSRTGSLENLPPNKPASPKDVAVDVTVSRHRPRLRSNLSKVSSADLRQTSISSNLDLSSQSIAKSLGTTRKEESNKKSDSRQSLDQNVGGFKFSQFLTGALSLGRQKSIISSDRDPPFQENFGKRIINEKSPKKSETVDSNEAIPEFLKPDFDIKAYLRARYSSTVQDYMSSASKDQYVHGQSSGLDSRTFTSDLSSQTATMELSASLIAKDAGLHRPSATWKDRFFRTWSKNDKHLSQQAYGKTSSQEFLGVKRFVFTNYQLKVETPSLGLNENDFYVSLGKSRPHALFNPRKGVQLKYGIALPAIAQDPSSILSDSDILRSKKRNLINQMKKQTNSAIHAEEGSRRDSTKSSTSSSIHVENVLLHSKPEGSVVNSPDLKQKTILSPKSIVQKEPSIQTGETYAISSSYSGLPKEPRLFIHSLVTKSSSNLPSGEKSGLQIFAMQTKRPHVLTNTFIASRDSLKSQVSTVSKTDLPASRSSILGGRAPTTLKRSTSCVNDQNGGSIILRKASSTHFNEDTAPRLVDSSLLSPQQLQVEDNESMVITPRPKRKALFRTQQDQDRI